MLNKEEIKNIKNELKKVLQDDEKINDILEGIYSGIEIINNDNNKSGILFISNKKMFFISYEESKINYEEFLYKDILSLSLNETGKYKEIIINLKNSRITFKALNNDESVYDFIERFKKILNKQNSERKENYNKMSNFNFLFLESKKINPLLISFMEKYNNFDEILVNDLINLSFLSIVNKKALKDEEIFFMTTIMIPLHIDIGKDVKEKINNILRKNELNSSDLQDIYKIWPKIARFFPEEDRIIDNSLSSLKCMKKMDNEHGSNDLDKLQKVFFNFVQCLIKADGTITDDEMRTEKIINEIIYNKEYHSQGSSDKDETKKDNKDSKKEARATEDKKETLEDVMNEINKLIGMKNIKEEIKTLINLIKIKKEREQRELPNTSISLHAVFYGPPGTGKTTIARLLGRVYKCLGLLKKGHIIETDRAGLVAGYVGQTAIQVNKIVEDAKDGVLFIDEAYALKPETSGNDFGQEAIDTILKRMEDYRDNLVIIVAGYPDEMQRFIESNPGLKSRFSRYFYFKDYTPEELLKIFEIFCKNASLTLTKKAKEKLLELFKKLYLVKTKTFGNGRLARNIFEKTIENQANRLVSITPLTTKILSTIVEKDIKVENE